MSTEIYLPHTAESLISLDRPGKKKSVQWLDSTPASTAGESRPVESYRVSRWCVSAPKRAFDLACVVPALIVLSPALALVAAAVRLSSSGPVIFRQQRAGRHRKLFTIYKFRTMVENSESLGPALTATGDPRITRIGHFLRRFKLDELPQLFNVLRGDMSLVGSRPKLPELELTSMPCRPGITGAATVFFRKEQRILREVPADQIGSFYARYIAPAKVKLDADYMRSASFLSDLGILRDTLAGRALHVTPEDLVIADIPQSAIVVESN